MSVLGITQIRRNTTEYSIDTEYICSNKDNSNAIFFEAISEQFTHSGKPIIAEIRLVRTNGLLGIPPIDQPQMRTGFAWLTLQHLPANRFRTEATCTATFRHTFDITGEWEEDPTLKDVQKVCRDKLGVSPSVIYHEFLNPRKTCKIIFTPSSTEYYQHIMVVLSDGPIEDLQSRDDILNIVRHYKSRAAQKSDLLSVKMVNLNKKQYEPVKSNIDRYIREVDPATVEIAFLQNNTIRYTADNQQIFHTG